ncbi:MAG TPA: hypothetical protein DD376_05390 [Sutterella sp.]|nr:hypothetical protein [Sutterella sp.]
MQNPLIDPVISVEQLKSIEKTEDLVILDCRGTLTTSGAGNLLFDVGHIPGAFHVDMSRDITGKRNGQNGRTPMADPEVFAQTLRKFGVNRTSTVVVYDTGLMNFAPRVWFTIRATGLANAFVLDGGFAAWQEAGYPITGHESVRKTGNFTAAPCLERIFSTEEIEQNLLTHRYLLLDARIEEVYLGSSAGPDAKAGHIPGSVNHPNRLNVAQNGLLLSKETLRRTFLRLSDGHPERIVHTCGSGIAACGNLVAMRHAGLASAGVYIGSFSAWISNPMHPISTEDES